jgi:hypothetical protein
MMIFSFPALLMNQESGVFRRRRSAAYKSDSMFGSCGIAK